MATLFTPYSTVAPLFGGDKPSWIPDELEQARVQAYDAYERMYWNAPDTFAVTMRGSNEAPIYVPNGRIIVDTINRFTAPGFGVAVSNRAGGEDSADVLAARIAVSDLMKRERFKAKFNGNKRYGLMKGDAVWHITADETKPVGSRLIITAMDPGMYFPIFDPEDVDRVIGCHLVEYMNTEGGPRVKRQTYRKVPGSETNTITVEIGLFEVEGWMADDATPAQVIKPPTTLPDTITALPVYHVKNFEEPGHPFGSSEMRGLEILMTAVNQTISDEDLSLVLAGVGTYVTTSANPVDPDTKQPIAWRLGPGQVIKLGDPEDRFDRLDGVRSVIPYGDHYGRLTNALKAAAATPDIAIGSVDVQVAASGIALSLQLGPLLAKATEHNDLILGVMDQMWYDILNGWMPAYEETTFNEVDIASIIGDAVPVDRAARFAELNDMLDRGVIDAEYYRSEAAKLGYVFPEGIGPRATTEFAARNSDQFATRADTELQGEETDGTDTQT
jgi:hypothetical protein